MSDQSFSEKSDALPDPVEDFAVEVEESDGGFAVVKEADGERSVVEEHPDLESAQQQADLAESAANRYEGAAREEEVPDSYPGKGVDERENVPPESSGASETP